MPRPTSCRASCCALMLASLLCLGCGSKTGLHVPVAAVDASADATPGLDGGADAGTPDECIELPPEAPPSELIVSFESRILSADVLFLVDTTGSMDDEIAQIRRTLRDVLVPEMVAVVGDVRFSVASFADFPIGEFGAPEDLPYLQLQASTDDVSQVQSAIDRLPLSSGSDTPESQVEALFQVATGEGIGRWVPDARCPAGTVGYPCFRADGTRIVLLFTDATFHNGPGGSEPYLGVSPTPHTYSEAVTALTDIGAKVLGLFSGGADAAAYADLRQIALDTGAVTPDGTPIVFDIGFSGEALDTGVVSAMRTLVEEVPVDIDVLVEDWPGDSVDAVAFVRGVEALRAMPVDGAINRGDRFDRVVPGTRVFFRIVFQNDRFPRMADAQIYRMQIVLRGDDVTRLQTTVVDILVPGDLNETCADVGR